MAEPFITTYGEVDFSQLRQEAIELLEAKFPGWSASRADMLRWLIEGDAAIDAEVFTQMAKLEQAAFQRFGEAMAGVPRIQAAFSTVESIWTVVDELGHEIEAGTQVGIPWSEGKPIGFETVGDVVIPPGSTKATILLKAIEPGKAGDGLSGTPELETGLSFVVDPGGIELTAVTAGGEDEEDEATYLGRLVERLRLRSDSLVLPYDFEVDARSYATIARALCIRGYNPDDESSGNPGHQCVFPIGSAGLPVGAEKEAELLAGQQALLIEGVVHHVAPPEYTTVDIELEGIAESGFDPPTVAAAIAARLEEYLEPATAMTPVNGESSGWVTREKVYRNDLIIVAGRIGGLERIEQLELAEHGKALGLVDVVLKGVAPLTKAGTITVNVK